MRATIRILGRFVTLCALGWWLGGLTFYSLFVIRAAHAVVGSHSKVGFVTQRVTNGLNALGTAALALLLVNLLVSWRSALKWNRIGLAVSWLTAAAAHAWVILLHGRLDAMLDFQARQVQQGTPFHGAHETYLIGTAVEWGAGLVCLLAALVAWRREDTTSGSPASAP